MVICIVFSLIYFLFGSRAGCLPIIELFIGLIVSRFLCQIDPVETYSWLSGIWHGICFIPNFLLSCDYDVLYKAECYTASYNVCWWLSAVASIAFVVYLYFPSLMVIFGAMKSDKNQSSEY